MFFGLLISENAAYTSALNIMSEKIPKTMADKFAVIAALVDAFCAKHLNDEYRQMIHHVVGALARKRPSPLGFLESPGCEGGAAWGSSP